MNQLLSLSFTRFSLTILTVAASAALLALPVSAQAESTRHVANGKVIDVIDSDTERRLNPDGTVTTRRHVVMESGAIGEPESNRHVTRVTSTSTRPVAALVYDGIVEPYAVDGEQAVTPAITEGNVVTERRTLHIQHPDGSEDIRINERQEFGR